MRRYMCLLSKRAGNLLDTASAETVLLDFPGERSVRCARGDLDALVRTGLAVIDDEEGARKLALTSAGRAALRREPAENYAGQHRQLRQTDIRLNGNRETVAVNDLESPLAALARLRRSDGRPWLQADEVTAGERLRVDFERAMLQPRITASWDISRVAQGHEGGRNRVAEISDGAISARCRVNDAVDALGPELGGALVDVCCFLKGLEQLERERGWPRRSAKLMLKTALAMLHRHYHPEQDERPADKILRWGAEGFRPTLSAKG